MAGGDRITVFTFLARVFLIASRVLYRTGMFFDRRIHEKYIMRATRMHDMMTHPDESYYARQYMCWIMPVLERSFPQNGILLLDLACGHGRLTLPLSDWNKNGNVIAVDFTDEVIRKAEVYCGHKDNLQFITSDIYEYLKRVDAVSVDAIACIEAMYVINTHKEMLGEVYRVLKPGGIAFLGFRSQYYNLLDTIRHRRFEGTQLVLEAEEGKIMGGPVWYSWHTKEQITGLLGKIGFKEIECYGIGPFSGIEGDPLEHIARPSSLTEKEQSALFEIETGLAKQYTDCGRYILSVAIK